MHPDLYAPVALLYRIAVVAGSISYPEAHFTVDGDAHSIAGSDAAWHVLVDEEAEYFGCLQGAHATCFIVPMSSDLPSPTGQPSSEVQGDKSVWSL
jgi:hypothetical protein